eukprot:4835019-Alexandrium_andersonii.AAC.1
MWALLGARVWHVEHPSAEEAFLGSLGHLRSELFNFYSREAAAGHHHTRLAKLTPKMVGSKQAPRLKLKAMETFGFA